MKLTPAKKLAFLRAKARKALEGRGLLRDCPPTPDVDLSSKISKGSKFRIRWRNHAIDGTRLFATDVDPVTWRVSFTWMGKPMKIDAKYCFVEPSSGR